MACLLFVIDTLYLQVQLRYDLLVEISGKLRAPVRRMSNMHAVLECVSVYQYIVIAVMSTLEALLFY